MGYSPVELQQTQAEVQVIGKLLQAKQANCRPSVAPRPLSIGTVGSVTNTGWSVVAYICTTAREV